MTKYICTKHGHVFTSKRGKKTCEYCRNDHFVDTYKRHQKWKREASGGKHKLKLIAKEDKRMSKLTRRKKK